MPAVRRERKHFRPKTIYSSEYEVFLRLLREARDKSGLTQEQIAERLGQDQAMVSRCFTGSRRVDVVELKSFCRVLGLSFSDFTDALDTAWRATTDSPDSSGNEEEKIAGEATEQ